MSATRNKLSFQFTDQEVETLTQLFPDGVVFFDFEMSGLSPFGNQIIEIGAVKIQDKTLNQFHQLIHCKELGEKAQEIHQISLAELQDETDLKSAIQNFTAYCEDLALIAHSPQLDVGHLVKTLHQFQLPSMNNFVYDSAKMFKNLVKSNADLLPEKVKLELLAEHYQLKFIPHQALEDAAIIPKIITHFCKNPDITTPYMQEAVRRSCYCELAKFEKLNIDEYADHYPLYVNAIKKEKDITIHYQGSNRKGERKIKPIAIVPLPYGLALYGHCYLSDMRKYFFLKKIKGTPQC